MRRLRRPAPSHLQTGERRTVTLDPLIESRLTARRPTWSDRPYFALAMGGGSASGKSTIAGQLSARLAPLRVEVLGQDRFFKPADDLPPYLSTSRPQPWPDYNRPDSFRLDELVEACAQPRDVDVLILEGILVLHYPEVRALMDLCLYVDADADERIVRRIRRNLEHYSIDDIADYYLESVRFQHDRYNAPTKAHADRVIPGGAADEEEREALLQELCEALKKRLPPAF